MELEGKSPASGISNVHDRQLGFFADQDDFLLASGRNARLKLFPGVPHAVLFTEDFSADLPNDAMTLLIDNGSYLTAVKLGPWQNAEEVPAAVVFAQGVQRIDVPALGKATKFEKTLIQPTDEPIIRIEYTWKGN
jgi:hypothetical protein